jgi:EAL domain-containing protein (putative c-di-GMP-specific phosphodiesterase class I)/CHASE2 domain-containing sensor protein
VRTSDRARPDLRPWKTLLWIAVAGLVFGVLGIGEIGDDFLRTIRNKLHPHSASGDIVLVKIDDQSLKQIGRWPWPRRYHASLIDRLSNAGAKSIFVDFDFIGSTDSLDDQALESAIKRSGRVVLPARFVGGATETGSFRIPSSERFALNARIASIAWHYNYQNAVWRVPYASRVESLDVASFSALLSNRLGAVGDSFIPDYSIDVRTIPSESAIAIINGSFDPKEFRGKDVVIAQASDALGDIYYVPGVGQMAGGYIHVIAAETLKASPPLILGWLPLFLAALCVAATIMLLATERLQFALLGLSVAIIAFGPALAEAKNVYLDSMPALLVLVVSAGKLARDRFRKRGLVDPVSGLPNLTALKDYRQARDQALIVARVVNYAEVVAAVPSSSEKQLVNQIITRLSVGAKERLHFKGDGGVFAWFDDPKKPFGHHLEALHALFRTPVRVGGMSLDLSVSFGVEIGSGRSLANRLASALVAAEEAAHDGLKWKYHDPHSLQDATWKLSMLSQLDDAVDRGEVWIAYQPKVDIKTRKVVGAEALARWTHPQKGPIAAAEFVAAAEQHDRIGKLTAFMLDGAIAAAALLNRRNNDFDMSVNLSGRLLGDRALVGRIAILLERHGLDPKHLTLELTETAALAGSGEALDMLVQLRELGINISIDDYGTGLSTLEYLKKIPASEIKIDQSFIKGMVENRSERLMVGSTIALAHSLDRRVVAEGVETRETLELLAEMECDLAQGFVTGRPMSLESLRRRLLSDRRSQAA